MTIHEHSLQYSQHASIVFTKVEEGIYLIEKVRPSRGDSQVWNYDKGTYVNTSKVIDALNDVEKVLIQTERMLVLHRNFSIEEEEE